MSSQPPVFKITPGVQSYDWGKIGKTSYTAQFAEVCLDGFKTVETKPYAELWMGTHVTLPSTIPSPSGSSSPSIKLSQVLTSNPSLLGEQIAKKYPTSVSEGQLPFLFKVLSIGKALSIQAHPDKKLAEKLFKERGDIYKDPNHKPEMAIALTPFRGFCGFLPLPVLLLLLTTVPELTSLIGEKAISALASSIGNPTPATLLTSASKSVEVTKDSASAPKDITPTQKSALKEIFSILMKSSKESVSATLKTLIARYSSEDPKPATSFEKDLVELVLELNGQYPDDVGVLCSFMLNVTKLGVGESVFLKADEPHAYIDGDIIECMATSDNVVRAGLTPKLRDVDTLISMLTYTSAPAHSQLQVPAAFSSTGYSLLYDPPIEEFSVVRVAVPAGKTESHRVVEGPSIVIVTDGSGNVTWSKGEESLDVKRGEVIFLGAGEEVEWKASSEELVCFRAYVEV